LGVKLPRFAKAIAPERTQRYDSALSLALDIERYLAQQPLEAVPLMEVVQGR
jgi:hypothetical protein